MNSEVLYHGRPFGGCSVLFNSALSHCIDVNVYVVSNSEHQVMSYMFSMYIYHVILIMRTTHMIIIRSCQLFLTIVVTIRLHIAF